MRGMSASIDGMEGVNRPAFLAVLYTLAESLRAPSSVLYFIVEASKNDLSSGNSSIFFRLKVTMPSVSLKVLNVPS